MYARALFEGMLRCAGAMTTQVTSIAVFCVAAGFALGETPCTFGNNRFVCRVFVE